MAQERCEALRAECEARAAALEGVQMRLREALASQTASCQQWEAQLSSAQVGLASCRPLRWVLPAVVRSGGSCQLSSAQVGPAQTVGLHSECMTESNRG